MTKAELIERIARSRNLPPDITKKDIAAILGIAFEELAGYFAKAKVTRSSAPRFTFPRFGTFTKKKRPARRGVNPRTLEPMQIDASCTVDFKASKELRDQMNGSVGRTATKAKAKAPTRGASKSSTRTTAKSASKSSSKTAGKSSSKSTTKRSSKSTSTSTRRTKVTAAKRAKVAPSGRRLTPRDEDAELDALIDDDSLFVELPATRLKRVRPRQGEGGEGSSETG
jgi:DNA-binding protein HU-beta